MNKSLLIRLHLYAGIFTSFYLVIFGFSSIVLNHKIKTDNTEITNEWQTQVVIDPTLSNQKLAEDIRDQLDIMGWTLYWLFEKDSTHFKYQIEHLGRKYFVKANINTGDVKISEVPKGLLSVFHGLHFFNGKILNAPWFLKTWAIYQWLALFIMGISLVLGLWLWIKYSYKPWQGILFGFVSLLTIITMLLI